MQVFASFLLNMQTKFFDLISRQYFCCPLLASSFCSLAHQQHRLLALKAKHTPARI
jgi:hypothetical protein